MKYLKVCVIIISTFVFSVTCFPSESKSSWSYSGATGPNHWGQLNFNYSACKNGKSQSPININEASPANPLKPIHFYYKKNKLKVINNGHTIQVDYNNGSYIEISGKKYYLLQFHFHSLSEHQINGQHYPLECHFVHKSEDGELAVVGVFFFIGNKNSNLSAIWDSMPQSIGMNYTNTVFNASTILPVNQSYYGYSGSLTTPPCTEGVLWHVLENPIELSDSQLKQFSSIIQSNYRPVQKINHRTVEYHQYSKSYIKNSNSFQSSFQTTKANFEISNSNSALDHKNSSIQTDGNHHSSKMKSESNDKDHDILKIEKKDNSIIWTVTTLALISIFAFFILYALLKGIGKKNMSFKVKISGMILILVIISITSLIFAIIKINSIGSEITEIEKEDLPLTKTISDIEIMQLEQSLIMEKMFKYNEMQLKGMDVHQKIKESVSQFNKLNQKINTRVDNGLDLAKKAFEHSTNEKSQQEYYNVHEKLKNIRDEHGGYEKAVLIIVNKILNNKAANIYEELEQIEKEERELEHKLKEFLYEIEEFTHDSADIAEKDEKQALIVLIIISALTVILSAVVIFYIIKVIRIDLMMPISNIIEELIQASEQTFTSSSQLAGSSQELASQSSEQAASVEESTTSLSELSEMANNNSDIAESVKRELKLVNNAVDSASSSMSELKKEISQLRESMNQSKESMDNLTLSMNNLTKGMDSIKTSTDKVMETSHKTSEIIKVIEEIAFQTNLLALNAAVEAARAGEAGMGFAVVADEVRALAQNAGSAAKEIGELISDSIDNTKKSFDSTQEGYNLLVEVNSSIEKSYEQIESSFKITEKSFDLQNTADKEFNSIVAKIDKLNNLVDEVVKTSSDQANGVIQINSAMTEMASSVQENAAIAEETAASSEELSAQSKITNKVVSNLSRLVLNKDVKKGSTEDLDDE